VISKQILFKELRYKHKERSVQDLLGIGDEKILKVVSW
jgi:hypothetical protein